MNLPTLVECFRIGGVNLIEVDGWETRRSGTGPFTPLGFMFHHTAGIDSLQLEINKALVQLHATKNGEVHLISDGRTAHPGRGSSTVLDRMRNEQEPLGNANDHNLVDDTDGYRWYWGIELENLGNGQDPFPTIQLEQAFRAGAVICMLNGWNPMTRVVEHKEWTRRKIDLAPNAYRFNTKPRSWVAHYIDVIRKEASGLPDLIPDPEPDPTPADLAAISAKLDQMGKQINGIEARSKEIYAEVVRTKPTLRTYLEDIRRDQRRGSSVGGNEEG